MFSLDSMETISFRSKTTPISSDLKKGESAVAAIFSFRLPRNSLINLLALLRADTLNKRIRFFR